MLVHRLIAEISRWKQKMIRDALEMGRNNGMSDGIRRHIQGGVCPSEVLSFLDNVGITVCKGYGLTKTSPIIALSVLCDGMHKLGAVGKCVDGVNMVIMDPNMGREVEEAGKEGVLMLRAER